MYSLRASSKVTFFFFMIFWTSLLPASSRPARESSPSVMLPASEKDDEESPASASEANVEGTGVYRCDVQGTESVGRRGIQALRVRMRAGREMLDVCCAWRGDGGTNRL